MENIIECNNLTHYYGKRLIYENLSFTVPKGRILGLLGKNGTGKTTTINILSGYLKPRSGQCAIFGQDIQTMALSPPEHRSAHRRTRAISVHDYSANRKILFGFLPQTMEKGSLLRINEQTESGAETAYFENVLRTTLAGSFRTNPGAESGTTGTG